MSFTDEEVERYARHLVLREIGGPGQQKLKAARVLIVGAGGLGAPAALYLAAAGVGHISLADPDRVSLSNLQRQILYRTEDDGAPKVERAADRLAELNPHVAVEPIDEALTPANAADLVAGHDLVLDGTDDFATRFAVNAACVAAGVTLVSGAIGRWTGQVGVFAGRPCYQCLVPEIPPDAETCSAVGVVGALAGVVGSMMALEAVKLIAGAGEPLAGRLFIYDALAAESRTVRIGADPQCPVCGETRKTPFLAVYDYGTGGVWAVIQARSADAIHDRYPALTVVSERPAWMDREARDRIDHFDIDEPPPAWLAELSEAQNDRQ